MEKLLIVDDDPELRKLLSEYLRRHGYDALLLADTTELDAAIARYNPVLLILDRMLPSGDGAQTVRQLRERGEDIPVILLTARDETADRILGLELGSDDYLTKPFDPRELVARIQTVLRRKKGASATSKKISFGPYVYDATAHTLTRDGIEQELTSSELALVQALVTHPNRKLSREELLQLSRSTPTVADETADRAIDVAIFRLRRIIEHNPKRPRFIRTVWGIGYMFVPDGKEF